MYSRSSFLNTSFKNTDHQAHYVERFATDISTFAFSHRSTPRPTARNPYLPFDLFRDIARSRIYFRMVIFSEGAYAFQLPEAFTHFTVTIWVS